MVYQTFLGPPSFAPPLAGGVWAWGAWDRPDQWDAGPQLSGEAATWRRQALPGLGQLWAVGWPINTTVALVPETRACWELASQRVSRDRRESPAPAQRGRQLAPDFRGCEGRALGTRACCSLPLRGALRPCRLQRGVPRGSPGLLPEPGPVCPAASWASPPGCLCGPRSHPYRSVLRPPCSPLCPAWVPLWER